MLVFNGASNAIVEMSLTKDLNGPGWINVTTIVLEIQDKYAEDQVQCPSIRSKVSEKRTKVKTIMYRLFSIVLKTFIDYKF